MRGGLTKASADTSELCWVSQSSDQGRPWPWTPGPPQPGRLSPGEEEQRSELCWRWEGGVRSAPHRAVWVAYDSGSAWRERKGNSG